jgi:hypothetical protein
MRRFRLGLRSIDAVQMGRFLLFARPSGLFWNLESNSINRPIYVEIFTNRTR